MFRHYDNLKRAIALLGIVLTLSPCTQATHFFCHLVGCEKAVPIGQSHENTIATAGQAIASAGACGCAGIGCIGTGHIGTGPSTTGSDANPTLLGAWSGQDASAGDEESPCPCLPGCCCHQAPDPFSMPKGGSMADRLVSSGAVHYFTSLLTVTAGSNLPLPTTVLDPNGRLSAISAGTRCIELCRFLI